MAKRRKAQTPVEASQSSSGTSNSMKQPSLSDVALDPEIMRQMAAAISRQGMSGEFAPARPLITPELARKMAAAISLERDASRPQLGFVWDKALRPVKELEAERQRQLAERQRVEQEIQEERRLRIELMRRQLADPASSPKGMTSEPHSSPLPQWRQGDVERRLQALEAVYSEFSIHMSAAQMAELIDMSDSAVKKSNYWRGTKGDDGEFHGGIKQRRLEEKRHRQRLYDHAELT